MSYDSREASRDSGRPYGLAQFIRGSTENRFTTLAGDVTAFGETFFASPFTVGKITAGGRIKRDVLDLDFPATEPFAQDQIKIRGPQIVAVTVWRNHIGEPDTEARVVFKGRVIAAKPSVDKITVTCSSVYSMLRNPGLNRRVLRTCDHVLYQGGCRLDRADWESAGTVTASTGLTHTIPAASGHDDGYFKGGILDFDGALGFIIKHTGSTVITRAPVPGLLEEIAANGSADVTIAPGCNRSRSTCLSKFDNLDNFGGFDFIPKTNPFGGSSSW